MREPENGQAVLKAIFWDNDGVLVTIYIAPCLFCAVEEWKWKRATKAATATEASA